MNFMKTLLITATFVLPSIVQTMEKPESAALQEETKSLFGLPQELEVEIIKNLANANTIEPAVNNIRSFASASRSSHAFINDPYITHVLMNELNNRFIAAETHVLAASCLGTKGACNWIKEDRNRRQQLFECFFNIVDFGATLNLAIIPFAHRYFPLMIFKGRNDKGYTPLISAAICGNQRVCMQLIKAGADLETPDVHPIFQFTPLMHAARMGHNHIIQLLLESGAAINAQNKPGATALMVAAREGCPAVVETLLKSGAEPNIEQPIQGKNALEWALDYSIHMPQVIRDTIIKLLKHHGAQRSERYQVFLRTLGTL